MKAFWRSGASIKWTSSPQFNRHHLDALSFSTFPSFCNTYTAKLALQFIQHLPHDARARRPVLSFYYCGMYRSLLCRINSRNSLALHNPTSSSLSSSRSLFWFSQIDPILRRSSNSSVPRCHTRPSIHFQHSNMARVTFFCIYPHGLWGRNMEVWLIIRPFSTEVRLLLWLGRGQL
jgi:hypothetical protein